MAQSTAKKREKTHEIEVVELIQHEAEFYIIGTTAFYCNRVGEKAKRELLFPRGRLTAGQRQSQLKHNPPEEFVDSAYRRRGDGPTRIQMRATAIKGAVAQSAIDMPTEVAKAQIDRLVYVMDEMIDIYGIPLLNLDIVRNSDMKHTPDMRTRAKIFPWCSKVRLKYTVPMLNLNSIYTLLQASGSICGIGDYRQQKGKGNFGLYRVIGNQPDEEWLRIAKSGGMKQQDEAFVKITCSDPDSEDLLEWWYAEVMRRRTAPVKPTATKRKKKEQVEDEPETLPIETLTGKPSRASRTNGPAAK